MNNYEKSIPTFQTDRFILKAVTSADTPAYQKHFNNYAVISQLSSAVPWPYPDDGRAYALNFNKISATYGLA